MKKKIATVILTFNSEAIIKRTILAAKKISKDVVICDSFSNDITIKITVDNIINMFMIININNIIIYIIIYIIILLFI